MNKNQIFGSKNDRKTQIIVTGSLGFDYIMNFQGQFADRIMPDKAHKISLSFLVDSMQKQFGGTAGNIAYSLQLLGMRPKIVAPAGNDFDSYLKFLERAGMDVSGIRVFDDVPTGSYFVITDSENNQIGAFYSGALKHAIGVRLDDVEFDVSSNKNDSFVVISPTAPNAMKSYVSFCRANGLRYLYDPAFQIGDFSADELREGIEGAEIVIGNDYEISLIEQKLNMKHSDWAQMQKILITTLGSQGSRVERLGEVLEIPIAPVESALDPTGAGDAFRSGFLAGYLSGKSVDVCGRMGAVASAYTVEKYGTVTHAYTLEEFNKRYDKSFGKKIAHTEY